MSKFHMAWHLGSSCLWVVLSSLISVVRWYTLTVEVWTSARELRLSLFQEQLHGGCSFFPLLKPTLILLHFECLHQICWVKMKDTSTCRKVMCWISNNMNHKACVSVKVYSTSTSSCGHNGDKVWTCCTWSLVQRNNSHRIGSKNWL